jgi:iron-sulfur cluster assembly protein
MPLKRQWLIIKVNIINKLVNELEDHTLGIKVSEAAANRALSFLKNRGSGIGLRLGVKTTGCSGLAYVLEFVDEVNADDSVFEDNGLKVIIDGKSLVYLDGTNLDFAKEGLNEGFQFNNPNANGECGCGESFNV